MALATSARRDQRRRLVASWNRSAVPSAVADEGGPSASPVTAYDDDAHPGCHPALATRLPTSLGGLMLAAIVALGGMGGAIALAVAGPLFGRPLFSGEGRFAGTLAVLKRVVDPTSPMPLHTWLAVLSLLLAAAVAGSVKFMRRHRRDDYKGRFRGWGWVATLLTVAAWSAAVPVGQLVAVIMGEVTGITLGPGGVGWWYALVALAMVVVLPWAILPLRQRMGTACWAVAAMLSWTAAAAMSWAEGWVGGSGRAAVIASAAWAGGASLLLVALLTAARGVIREVRGEVLAKQPKRARREQKSQARATQAAEPRDESFDESSDDDEAAYEPENDETEPLDFTDGSEGGERRLSKAERKRLKKLARMNGHAA